MSGFLNRLMNSGAFGGGLDPYDPLFGGLIPRREIIDTQAAPVQRGMLGGQQRVANQPTPIPRISRPSDAQGMGGGWGKMNVVYDDSMERMDLAKKVADREERKFQYEQHKDKATFEAGRSDKTFEQNLNIKKHELDESKFEQDKSKDKLASGINERKQALDEWKSKNPDGQVEVAADGKIMVINKTTGKSIDTGLVSNDLSEEEKLKLQHGYATSEIDRRAEQSRLTNATRPRAPISASQQRVAEDDAAAELLRDPTYSWLSDKKFITKGEKGEMIIKRPTAADGSPDNVKTTTDRLLAFEKAWKEKTNERLNKQFNAPPASSLPGAAKPAHNMLDPKGNPLNVPPDQIQSMLDAGATMVAGAPLAVPASPKPMPEVDDSIELYYNDKGKIIGSRNRKNTNISPFER